jgi:hypothetical protein
MNLLREPISRLRSSPYASTAPVLDTTSVRSLRFLHALISIKKTGVPS